MCVVYRIREHSRRQRTPRPIRLLRTFRQLDTEVAFYQRRQTEFTNAKQAPADQRVENSARNEVQTAAKHSQVVVRAVQNNFLAFQRSPQRRKIDIRQRVDDGIAPRQTDLEQTKFLSITMKAISLRIDCHAINRFDFLEQLG